MIVSRTVVMAIALFLTAGSARSQVISVPPMADQTGGEAPAAAARERPDQAPVVAITMAAASVAIGVLFLRRRWDRLPASLARPRIMSPGASLTLFIAFHLLAMASGLVVVALGVVALADDAEAARSLSLKDSAVLALGRAAAQMAGVAVFLRLCIAAGPAPSSRPGPLRAALVGACSVILAWPLTYTAGYAAGRLWSLLRGEPPDPIAHDTLRVLISAEGGGWFVVLVLCVLIVAPIVEEIMYRGLLQDMLRRMGMPAWWAIVTTSLIFALMHWGNARPHALVALFVLSLGFGWSYERTGRLAAPMTMHLLFNAGNLALGLWVGEP
jgi:membrane protease YdiL (CAAX protease family)